MQMGKPTFPRKLPGIDFTLKRQGEHGSEKYKGNAYTDFL
jgi:hypothetical protein